MIRIQNIYYMLAYAFQALRMEGYSKVATEQFDNVAELCAALLCKGVSLQLKRGLGRTYVDKTEELGTLRGKVEVSESVKTQSLLRKRIVCSHDQFSVNTRMNRILKATMLCLLRADIKKTRKKELRKLLVFFADVGVADLPTVDWHMRYDRNNQTYRMPMGVCWLVAKGLLQTQSNGPAKLRGFVDEQYMHRLYEKFILEYYRKEHRELRSEASQIPWALGEGDEVGMLPTMQTDITLSQGNRVLIIDAKYYARNTQARYGSHKVVSGNLYQMFTYVKNREAGFADVPHEVSGMLLYAKTDDAVQPSGTWHMGGNRIDVATLDLNADFSSIANQLDGIVHEFFAL